MGVFDKVAETKASVGGNYIQAGRYIVRIERLKKDKRTTDGVEYVAIEQAILQTLADGRPDLEGKPVKANQPGDTPTHLLTADKLSFLGNFKAFLMRACEVEEAAITKADCEQAVGPENPLGGVIMEVDANVIRTRKGTPFTRVQYVRRLPLSQVADQLSDKVKALLYPGNALAEALAAEAE